MQIGLSSTTPSTYNAQICVKASLIVTESNVADFKILKSNHKPHGLSSLYFSKIDTAGFETEGFLIFFSKS